MKKIDYIPNSAPVTMSTRLKKNDIKKKEKRKKQVEEQNSMKRRKGRKRTKKILYIRNILHFLKQTGTDNDN